MGVMVSHLTPTTEHVPPSVSEDFTVTSLLAGAEGGASLACQVQSMSLFNLVQPPGGSRTHTIGPR